MRIISCDYYQRKPTRGLDETYSEFRASEIETVPVIRVFGITPNGQKGCLHVHSVFPYLSVPYHGELGETVHRYMRELATNIDNSLNTTINRHKKQHVYKIQLKMAIPYYGYHSKVEPFLQIFFYNPATMKRVTELLNSGSIMNTCLQPHEAHIPYILQFFIDYNLFGMNYIYAVNVKFRMFPQELVYQPLTSPLGAKDITSSQICDSTYGNQNSDNTLWDLSVLPINMVLGENVQRQTTCELELDCVAKFIQNQFNENVTLGRNPGLAAIWEDEKQRHREIFDNSKITPSASQERVDVKRTASELFYTNLFQEKMQLISSTQNSADITMSQNNSSSQMNRTDQENMEFLEMFRDILAAEESDSVLSTQKSDQIIFGQNNESSGDDSDDSLEMSRVFFQDNFNAAEVIEDEDIASSNSSIFQLGQKDPQRNESRTSNSEDSFRERAGCSFWLPQLDGAFDEMTEKDASTVGTSTFLKLTKKRKKLRKSQEPEWRCKKLSRSRSNEPLEQIEKLPRRRDATKTVNYSSFPIDSLFIDYICPNEILQELPAKATDAIFRSGVKIPNYIKLDHLKKLGSEKVVVNRIPLISPSEDSLEEVEKKPVKKRGRKLKNLIVEEKIMVPVATNQSLRLRSRSQINSSVKNDTAPLEIICIVNAKEAEVSVQRTVPNILKLRDTSNASCQTDISKVNARISHRPSCLASIEENMVHVAPLEIQPKENESVINEEKNCDKFVASVVTRESDTIDKEKDEIRTSTPAVCASSKTPIPILENGCDKMDETDRDIYHRDAMWMLSYMSPPTLIEKVTLIPPKANSPVEKELISIEKEPGIESEESDEEMILFLEDSEDSKDSVIKMDSTQNPPARESGSLQIEIVPTASFRDHSKDGTNSKLNTSFFEEISDSDDTVILPSGKSPILPQNCDSASSHCDSPLDDEESSRESGELNGSRDDGFGSSYLNTSVYSFENMDLSYSSLDDGAVKDINEDTEEYEVLVAPSPPARSEVESGGFEVRKMPDGTSKIDKQGYTINPYELDEFGGTFGGALAKLKSNQNPDFNSDGVYNENDTRDVITPLILPPCYGEVEQWCIDLSKSSSKRVATPIKEVKAKRNERATPNVGSSRMENYIMNQSTPQVPKYSQNTSRRSRSFSIRSILTLDKIDESMSPITQCSQPNSEESSSPTLKVPLRPKKILNNKSPQRNDTFSMIEGVSQNSSSDIPSLQHKFDQRKTHVDFITVMSLEVHCQTRGNLKPNPKMDEITAIFYCIQNQSPPHPSVPELCVCAIVVESTVTERTLTPGSSSESGSKSIFSETSKTSDQNDVVFGSKNISLHGCKCLPQGVLPVTTVANEKELFRELVDVLRRWDPEIIVGYEVEMLSWGYILERAALIDELLLGALSRVPKSRGIGATRSKSRVSILMEDLDSDNIPDIKVTGRIVLNVWKIMRKEVALTSYTFENVFYKVANKRVPFYDHKTLSDFFNSKSLYRWNLYEHYVVRVCGWIELLDHFNIVGRTSELARIFGIQFFEVFSRGSQFRVESMMLRMVKAANFIAVSPSVQQRAHSRAPETLPLILEPESKFYTDPVLVLDFQSLYPSIIIAYNYCYSTCLGRVDYLGLNEPFEFGCASLSVPLTEQKKLQNDITISPLGIAFVKPNVRRGIMPKMLDEILKTRIMVKKSMKENKDNKSVVKLLDARQLGLKLIANVTYGYTGANYSGRMPCVEVADSILSKSRETLQYAIKFVENNPKWGAHVVYGDTDSMFVRLPGRSKDEAFKIGDEIAKAVTDLNPQPVKLKFEKVYLPCVLQTKKRYVGFMYETVDQKEPVFDAKGIETVRRDNCPAVGKILEKALRILFTNRDVNPVKMYIQRQFQKLLSNRASIQDLVFAKEFRGINGYRPTAHVPALVIARRLLQSDPRAEPRAGERVLYVIVYGEPGLPLIKLVKEPHELLTDTSLRINSQYYVTRVVIPPLERIFCLLGVSVTKWLNELPRTILNTFNHHQTSTVSKSSLSQYFTRINCLVCERPSDFGFCLSCKGNPQMTLVTLGSKMNRWETAVVQFTQICQSCTGMKTTDVFCKSMDCPVIYRLAIAKKDLSQSKYLRQKMDACLRDLSF